MMPFTRVRQRFPPGVRKTHFRVVSPTEVRALDYARGTPEEMANWYEADAEARANLAIENMALSPDDAALFDMLREEAVPPPLATAIILKLLDHPAVSYTHLTLPTILLV